MTKYNDGINIPLLRKAVEWAEAEAARDDGRWNQQDWVLDVDQIMATRSEEGREAWLKFLRDRRLTTCGSAFCLAGYIAYLSDDRYEHDPVVDGIHAEDVAIRELGLDVDDIYQTALFSGHNSIEDIRRIAEEIAGGPL